MYIFSLLEELSKKCPHALVTDNVAQRASVIFAIKNNEMIDLFKEPSIVISMTDSEIEEWTLAVYDTIKSLGIYTLFQTYKFAFTKNKVL